jgi:tetratricopeptide (TPR) repeat protein
MRAYVRGQDLQVAGRVPEALAAYQEAVSLDAGFGRAYAGMGVIYGNLKQQAKAEESYQQAFKHTNRMTEREKYGTFGGYYLLVSHDYDKAVENYEALVQHYPADRGGHANLALAYLNKHQVDKALSEVRKALDLEPGNVVQRMNYAMYALYAGDFPTAIAESKKIPADGFFHPYALLTEGRAVAAGGDVAAAQEVFGRLEALGAAGAPLATIARADLAMFQGQFGRALEILRAPGPKDAAPDPADQAARAVMVAEAQNALGRRKEAAAAALQAIKISRDDEVLLPAAFTLGAVGQPAAAEAIAKDLDNRLQPQSRAYARLITADLALGDKRLPAALDALNEGKKRLDSWFVHLLLGRTYLTAGQAPEALAEFEMCLKRQGEATDVFFANGATLRYLSPVHYWLARSQEMLGNAGARQNYEWYVKLRGATDAADPMLIDSRARLAKLP